MERNIGLQYFISMFIMFMGIQPIHFSAWTIYTKVIHALDKLILLKNSFFMYIMYLIFQSVSRLFVYHLTTVLFIIT